MDGSAPQKQRGIYAITQISTGVQYIGSAKDFAVRWRIHRSDLRLGKHHSPWMQRVVDKYGMDAIEFTVLEYVDDVTRLIEREQWYLDDRFARKGSHEFNSSHTAGSPLGVVRPPELRQQWSEQRKGVPWTPERRAKFRYTDKMREANSRKKGQPVSDAQYAALTAITPNRLAHISKLVALQTGRPASETRKAKIRRAHQERWARLEAEGKLSKHPKAVQARERKRAKRLAAEHEQAQLNPPHQLHLFEE